MSFATTDALAEWLGVTFDVTQTTRAQRMLDSATSIIKSYAGQEIEQVVDDAVTLDGECRKTLLLPEIPVTALTSVVEDGTTLTVDDDFTWSANGLLTREGGRWPAEPRSVVVTYTHGYAAIPSEIETVCLSAAARLYENPQGYSSRQAEEYAVSYPSGGLIESERLTLDRFKA